jgi:DNA-directed RNA polymerase specialized sigma subunit
MYPKDRIILEHPPIVKTIAARMHENHLPVHVDMDDPVQAGCLGTDRRRE